MEVHMKLTGKLVDSDAAARAGAELPKDLIDTLKSFAMFEVEKPAAEAAQRLFEHPTGNLPTSIHTDVESLHFAARVGTNLEYARLREKGGVVNNAWGRGVVAVHEGRPYLVPALESAKTQIKAYFGKLLDNLVGKIAD